MPTNAPELSGQVLHVPAAGGEPLLDQIVGLLRKIVYAPEASLTPQTRLADLGLDSLDLVEAGLELEALIGHDLPDGVLAKARTVGDLARCISEPEERQRRFSLAA